MEVDVHQHLVCLTAEQCNTAEMHREACYYRCGLDRDTQMCFTALDLNGQGAPASRPSRSRRRTSEARRTGA